jgi:4'-phosphopantetheinyl transferase
MIAECNQQLLKLYQIDLQRPIASELHKILSTEEQDFAQTIRNESLKKQHLTVRVGVRQILADYLQQPSDKINLAKSTHGKPYLVDYPEIHFNISHSAETLLIAISKIGAVGIDIEQAKPHRNDFSALVEKCFASEEIKYWNALAETEKKAEFYRFWTRKEAFVKAVGRGIALGLEQCVIAVETSPRFTRLPKLYGKPCDWRLFDLPLTGDLYGALVIENRKIPSGFVLPKITFFDIK